MFEGPDEAALKDNWIPGKSHFILQFKIIYYQGIVRFSFAISSTATQDSKKLNPYFQF
jgi:hypothetical protein